MRYLLLVSFVLNIGLVACTTNSIRPELETFNREDDYNYNLANFEAAIRYRVQLGDQGFQWPILATGADTVFLEFQLEQTRGQIPAIGIEAGGVSLVQYFEEGGQGQRYLDLSALLGSAVEIGEIIQFSNQGADWVSEMVTLVTFTNPPLRGRRVLVVAPHPDDAEIAAFGVYQSSVADVVTVTAGDAGGVSFLSLWAEEGEHYREKGRIRTLDSLTVPLLGGLRSEAIRNLGYYDATLRQLWQQRPNSVAPPLAVLQDPAYYRLLNFDTELRNRGFVSSWPSLVADLLAELERVQPLSVVVPHPMLDRHLDHQFTAIAMIEALSQWGKECEILLYTNHAVGNEAFPLGPRDGVMGLPAWNSGDLFIRGIYSHQLSVADQRRKLIALEAMHDLRPFDPRDGSEVSTTPSIYDYFRRAVRPNELFLVTDLDGIKAMHEEYFRNMKEQ